MKTSIRRFRLAGLNRMIFVLATLTFGWVQFATTGCATSASIQPRKSIKIDGSLSDSDFREIMGLVAAQSMDFEKNVLQISVENPKRATVRLGQKAIAAGQLLFVDKRNGHWIVSGVGVWGR